MRNRGTRDDKIRAWKLAAESGCARDGSCVDVLLLDNRDSFVWNLAQAFGALGATVEVVRSDAVDVREITARRPRALVLSPGPGRPEAAGCCVEAVRSLSAKLPILGVCLGHQAIGVAFGAVVDRSSPCHGKAWTVHHRGEGLFADLPEPILACRYHSLSVVADTLPEELVPDAWTPEGVLMSVRHLTRPVFGLQFHPESFRTDDGPLLLRRFLELVA
jgi:anthranilate synthase/aminodeoxychorismate synthase-like glutamine amidotransferase